MAVKKQLRNGKSSRDEGKKREKEMRPIKKLKNGSVLYSNFWVRGPVSRLSFVNFETAKEREDDDGNKKASYGCAALFKKGADLSLLKEACRRFAIQEKGERGARYKNPLRLQDDKVDDYDGFTEGAYYFNTSSKYRPSITGRSKEEIEPGAFYSGCYAQLLFRPYIYEVKGNRGVGLGLAAAQFMEDGEPLGGGGVDANDYFDEHESEEVDDTDGEYSDEDYEEDAGLKRTIKKKKGRASEFI